MMKQLRISGIMACVILVSTSIAKAEDVAFLWSSFGSFSSLPNKLDFSGVLLDSANVSVGESKSIRLGSFGLDNVSSDDTGTFTLNVSFWLPLGAADPSYPNTPVFLDANYNGSKDKAVINFNNTARTLAFSGGSFDFSVDDATVFSTVGSVDLTGRISNIRLSSASTPEPQSVSLLCTVLIGVALMAKKRFMA
jgi:hypothetical protein